MQLLYTDPKKKRLQIIEIVALIVLLPPALFYGARSADALQRYYAAETLFREGHELMHAERLEEAADRFARAAETYPQFYAPWEGLAVCQHFLGRHEEELATYRKAVEALPEDGRLHRELAQAHHEKGDHEGELSSLRRAAELIPGDPLLVHMIDRAEREVAGTYPTEGTGLDVHLEAVRGGAIHGGEGFPELSQPDGAPEAGPEAAEPVSPPEEAGEAPSSQPSGG